MMPIEREEQEKDKSSINTFQSNPVNTDTDFFKHLIRVNFLNN